MARQYTARTQARLIREATEILSQEFFQPSCERLFRLLERPEPGVRVYAMTVLTDLVLGNMPAFAANALADVAYRLKIQAENDPDDTAQRCAAAQLQQLLEAVRNNRTR